MAREKADIPAETPAIVMRYTKEQITSSDKYRANKDLLAFKLEGGKLYTLDEIDTIVTDFKKMVITEKRNEVKM